ncbi:MAG: cytochrome c biogenesis protein CcsA [Sedimentisphaerales bacterium]|nr:cytochrome c biogenesis protein CcsA [Sedimentisphaerales bacterium]
MAIKYTVQGLLIYSTIAAYALAFGLTIARRKKAGRLLFALGFCIAVVSYIYRWVDVKHVPLQNLFEVFLFLGAACYPISWFCKKLLRIGGQWADMLIGAIVLFPAGFVFHAEPMQLPPALQCWLFTPHVAVYMLSYIFMAKAAFQAGEQLLGNRPRVEETHLPAEQATYELITVGFPLLTLGLILGSWWGKLAWGHYWGWDPKELWSLASWLVYVGYFHWRYMFGKKRPRINSLWAITGMVAIIVTLLWVNLSRVFTSVHSYAS